MGREVTKAVVACSVSGCGALIGAPKPFCGEHWVALSVEQRTQLGQLFREAPAGAPYLDAVKAAARTLGNRRLRNVLG